VLHKFPVPLQIGEDPSDGTIVLGFVYDDTFVFDPHMSSCSRFEVNPTETYGLTKEAAEGLAAMNRHLYAASDEVSKHAACRAQLAVQMGLGLPTNQAVWPPVDSSARRAVARAIAKEMLAQLGQPVVDGRRDFT
jgi:hypothetical protein